MAVKVAINGFGRIGRLAFRQMFGADVSVKNFDEYYALYVSREINKTQLAKKLGISRPTLNKLIEEYNEKQVSA